MTIAGVTGSTFLHDTTVYFRDVLREKLTYPADVVIDGCDSLTGWTVSNGTSPTLDTSTFKKGTASINMGKTSNDINFYYERSNISPVIDVSNNYFYVWLYIDDTATLNKLDSALAVEIGLSHDNGSNYAYLDVARSGLSVGWNLIGGLLSDFINIGTITQTSINYVYVWWFLGVGTSTIAHGKLKQDYYFTTPYSKSSVYWNSFVRTHWPERNTDYPMVSVSVNANGNSKTGVSCSNFFNNCTAELRVWSKSIKQRDDIVDDVLTVLSRNIGSACVDPYNLFGLKLSNYNVIEEEGKWGVKQGIMEYDFIVQN